MRCPRFITPTRSHNPLDDPITWLENTTVLPVIGEAFEHVAQGFGWRPDRSLRTARRGNSTAGSVPATRMRARLLRIPVE